MKKINKNDLFYSYIKAYPRVSFFANNGIVRYDKKNSTNRDEEVLFEVLVNNPPIPEEPA